MAQAAQLLGVTVEAVRGRIKRGTLKAERESDHVFVLLDTDQPRPATDQPTDQAQPGALLSAKDETIALLREQLEAERRANEENRRIIAALTSRIPEIEAPREPSGATEPREAPTGATPQPGRVEPQPSVEAADEAERAARGPSESAMGGGRVHRSWWRRMFGG